MAASEGVFSAADQKAVLDMGTSDKALMALAEQVFGDKGTDSDRNKFQIALQSRATRASAWSNILRTLSDIQRSVIQNLRA